MPPSSPCPSSASSRRASNSLHDKTIKTIARLDAEIASQKARVAKHWEGIRALGPADRGRVMAEQASAAIGAIRESGTPELNGILREAGTSYGPLVGQRPYWTSKAAVLNDRLSCCGEMHKSA